MKKKWLMPIFAGVALVQLAFPAYKVWRQERTLAVGQAFKFRTSPVDPYDAFRGRYIQLGFPSESHVPKPPDVTLGDEWTGRKIYAVVENDADGFARITETALARPVGKPYFEALVAYVSRDELLLDLPFDRFYLLEHKAPSAETLYRKHGSVGDSYLVVRILDGNWAVDDLYVGGRPITQVLPELKP